MAFMRVFAEQFDAYVVETTHGTEIVPADCVGSGPLESDWRERFAQYLEGAPWGKDGAYESPELVKGAWWGRLSAPGYTDCTEWDGPHVSEEKARAAVKAMFECADNGDIFDEGDDNATTDNAV